MSMVTRLRSWLAPPVFPADEEQTRVAGLLNTLLLAIIAGFGLAYSSATLLVPEFSIRQLVISAPICLLALVLLLVMRRGHMRFASAALSMGLWVVTTIAAVIGGGVDAPALGGYFVAVLIASLLLSWRAALGFAVLSVVAGAALLYATVADRLPPPYFVHTPAWTWASETIFFLLGTMLLILARRSMNQAMRRSYQELAERRRADAALRESEARYRLLASNFPNGAVLLFDRELRYTLAEGAGLLEAGLSKSALEGKTIWEVFAPETCRIIEPPFRAALAGTPTITDVPFQERIYRMHALPVIDAHGDVVSGMVMTQDATTERHAQAALKAREERYARSERMFKELVQSINAVVWEADAQTFAFSFVSEQAEKLLGYPVNAWLESPTFWADHIYPDDRDAAVSYCVRQTEELEDHEFEYRMLAADGRIVWLRDLVTVETVDNLPRTLRGVMVDVTERKQGEEEHGELLHKLHERVKELTALHNAARILQQGAMGTPALLRDLAALLPPAFQYPEVTAARVRLGDQEAMTAGFGDALSILRTDFTTADGAHGSIAVAYTAERPASAEGPFLAEERQLLESLGDMLRTAYDRMQAEAALRDSEVRFRAIFERAAIGIALVDVAGRPIESNPALQAMLGYSADELRGMPFMVFTHPDDIDADVQLFDELVGGRREFYQIPKRYIRKDGQVRWGNLRVSLIRDAQGGVQFAIGMVTDITERQQAEAALHQYTRRLEYLHDIDQIILTTPSLNQLAEAVISQLRTLIPCNRAELLFVDWEAEEAIIVAQVSDRPTSVPVGYRYSLAERPPRPALLEGQIVVEHDISGDESLSPSLQLLLDEGMRARILVPLLAQGQLIGTIHLAADQPFTPTEDQRNLARELADHLAIGLQHARLLAEVQATNARLQALSRQLVTAQEDERRRIARELHDEVGQALALVKLNIRAVQRAAGAAELAPRLEQSLGVIEDTLLRVRTLALDLRPSMLDDIGLLAALRWYVDQQASLSGLVAELSAADTLGRLPAEIETVCFRLVQEALTNVVRHAQARKVRVTVDRLDAAVELCISDDGIGFEYGAALARAAQGQSGGLLGMRERVALCGGRLTIESHAECGTTVRAQIPI